MTYLQQLRGLGYPVLLLDGGDIFFRTISRKAPSPTDQRVELAEARKILAAYNLFGYDAVAIGPQDLQFGLAELMKFRDEARFPILCANLVDTISKKRYFQPYTVIERGGVRFGVFAIIQNRLNPDYAKRVIASSELLPPIDVAKQIVAELKDKCDVIVALSHLYEKTNVLLLEKVPEIDALIDPSSQYGNKIIWVQGANGYLQEFHGRPRLRIDGQGSRVGVFEMELANKKLVGYQNFNVPLEPHLMNHPEVDRLLKSMRRGRKYSLPEDHDPSKMLPVDVVLGHEACGACHEQQYAFWKSTRHSNNFYTLEENGDQTRADCVGCHSLAYGISYVNPEHAERFKEVQCESCHGIVPDHAADPVRYRYDKVSETTCWGCHNPDYTKKPFKYRDAMLEASCPKSPG